MILHTLLNVYSKQLFQVFDNLTLGIVVAAELTKKSPRTNGSASDNFESVFFKELSAVNSPIEQNN